MFSRPTPPRPDAGRRRLPAWTWATLTLLAIGVLAPPAAHALGGEASVTLVSDYVWRGQLQYLERHQPSQQLDLQLTGELGPGELTLELWHAVALVDAGPIHRAGGNEQELVPILDYTLPLVGETLEASFGGTAYLDPTAGGDEVDPQAGAAVAAGEELYAGVSWASGWLDVGALLYADVRLSQGAYLELSLARTFGPAGWLELTPGLTLGGGRYRLDDETPTLADATLSLKSVARLLEVLRVELQLNWTLGDPLGELAAAPLADRALLWGGVGLAAEF